MDIKPGMRFVAKSELTHPQFRTSHFDKSLGAWHVTFLYQDSTERGTISEREVRKHYKHKED